MMKLTNLFSFSILATIVLLGAGCTSSDSGQNTKLATCLTEQGAIMYGTNRCSHCQAQKDLFGYDAFTKIKFVDCDKDKNVCGLEGIQGYPTWKFADGSKLEGTQTFDALAKAAGCNLDGVITAVTSTGIEQEIVTGEVMTGIVEVVTGAEEMISGAVSTGN